MLAQLGLVFSWPYVDCALSHTLLATNRLPSGVTTQVWQPRWWVWASRQFFTAGICLYSFMYKDNPWASCNSAIMPWPCNSKLGNSLQGSSLTTFVNLIVTQCYAIILFLVTVWWWHVFRGSLHSQEMIFSTTFDLQVPTELVTLAVFIPYLVKFRFQIFYTSRPYATAFQTKFTKIYGKTSYLSSLSRRFLMEIVFPSEFLSKSWYIWVWEIYGTDKDITNYIQL